MSRTIDRYKYILYCLMVVILSLCCFTGCATVHKAQEARFYPPPPQPPKIQFLTRINSSRDIETHSKFESFIVGDVESSRFKKPYGVEVYDGVIYICEPRLGTVLTIDLMQKSFDSIRDEGAGKLKRPINMTIDTDGTKYVVDMVQRKIMVYDRSNRFIRALGDPDQFKPVDVAVFKDRLYVLDIRDNEVEVLHKKTGELLSVFGEPGGEEGQLAKPTNLVADQEGNIYVTSTLTCKVEKFDSDGNFLLSVGKCGDSVGEFVRPKGVAVDKKGYLYVVDAAFENVQIFSPEGKPALFFGGPGGPDVPGALWLPAGITITYDQKALSYFDSLHHKDLNVEYLVLVSNQFGPAYINVYAFGEPKEGTPLQRGDVEAYDEEQNKLKSGELPLNVDEKSKEDRVRGADGEQHKLDAVDSPVDVNKKSSDEKSRSLDPK